MLPLLASCFSKPGCDGVAGCQEADEETGRGVDETTILGADEGTGSKAVAGIGVIGPAAGTLATRFVTS